MTVVGRTMRNPADDDDDDDDAVGDYDTAGGYDG